MGISNPNFHRDYTCLSLNYFFLIEVGEKHILISVWMDCLLIFKLMLKSWKSFKIKPKGHNLLLD